MQAVAVRDLGWRTSAGRGAALAAAALAVAFVHVPGRPSTLCVLRGATGVPCPLCGGTTAFVDLGHGRLPAALLASPLAVLGALALVAAPLVRPRPVTARTRWALILGVALVSELWQLHRFGFLPL